MVTIFQGSIVNEPEPQTSQDMLEEKLEKLVYVPKRGVVDQVGESLEEEYSWVGRGAQLTKQVNGLVRIEL